MLPCRSTNRSIPPSFTLPSLLSQTLPSHLHTQVPNPSATRGSPRTAFLHLQPPSRCCPRPNARRNTHTPMMPYTHTTSGLQSAHAPSSCRLLNSATTRRDRPRATSRGGPTMSSRWRTTACACIKTIANQHTILKKSVTRDFQTRNYS
jgi:hypothetical protein